MFQSCVSPKLAIKILYAVVAGIQMRFSRCVWGGGVGGPGVMVGGGPCTPRVVAGIQMCFSG